MVPHERTRSQFCCGLGPNGYRSAFGNIPTSTARRVRSSSQSISRPADDFGRSPAYRSSYEW
jgi:hypothetical protein